jgi:hypothetical protein
LDKIIILIQITRCLVKSQTPQMILLQKVPCDRNKRANNFMILPKIVLFPKGKKDLHFQNIFLKVFEKL